MYAETLNADFCRARAEFCYKLAATAHAARPLFARLYFLAREYEHQAKGAVRKVVGIRRGAISGNMKVSFQAARSIG